MELQPEALPFHEPDRCPPSSASFHQPFCDCPATLVMTMAPSRPTCLYDDHRMPDPVPCGEQDYARTHRTPPNAWPLRLSTTPLTSVMRRCSASAACLQTWLAKPAARTRSQLSFVPRWSRPFVVTLQRLPHSRSYGSEEVGHFAAIVRCALGMWSGKVPCNLRVHHCVAPLTWSNELAQELSPTAGIACSTQ